MKKYNFEPIKRELDAAENSRAKAMADLKSVDNALNECDKAANAALENEDLTEFRNVSDRKAMLSYKKAKLEAVCKSDILTTEQFSCYSDKITSEYKDYARAKYTAMLDAVKQAIEEAEDLNHCRDEAGQLSSRVASMMPSNPSGIALSYESFIFGLNNIRNGIQVALNHL